MNLQAQTLSHTQNPVLPALALGHIYGGPCGQHQRTHDLVGLRVAAAQHHHAVGRSEVEGVTNRDLAQILIHRLHAVGQCLDRVQCVDDTKVATFTSFGVVLVQRVRSNRTFGKQVQGTVLVQRGQEVVEGNVHGVRLCGHPTLYFHLLRGIQHTGLIVTSGNRLRDFITHIEAPAFWILGQHAFNHVGVFTKTRMQLGLVNVDSSNLACSFGVFLPALSREGSDTDVLNPDCLSLDQRLQGFLSQCELDTLHHALWGVVVSLDPQVTSQALGHFVDGVLIVRTSIELVGQVYGYRNTQRIGPFVSRHGRGLASVQVPLSSRQQSSVEDFLVIQDPILAVVLGSLEDTA